MLCSMNNKFGTFENRFDEISSNFNEKFDKINNHFDTNESNFNEIRNEIKQVNKRLDKTDEIFETKFNELEQSFERMGAWRINTGKCNVNENNEITDDNGVITGESNGNKMTKNNEEIMNEVSVSYKNELTSSGDENIIVVEKVSENNGDIIKNGVLESNMVNNNNSGDKVLVEIESSNKIVVDERLGWQRVNFPRVYCEPRGLQMFLKGKSLLAENDVFSSCSLSFCGVPGRARKCIYIVVPFAWNDRDRMKWCYDEKYFGRERNIELSEVSRNYKELGERMRTERVSNIVDLPGCENSAAVDDDNVDSYIECLSVHRRGILIVDDSENKERIKCVKVTDNNTDGDKTRINDVDRLYDLIIMWDNPVDYYAE